MPTPITKSTDYPTGVVPFTRAVVPQANIMVIGGVTIGYIQTLEEKFERPVNAQYEVGSVGIVEGLPGQPAYTLSVNKLKVYGQNLLKAMMESAYTENPSLKTAIKAQIKLGSSGSNPEREVFQLLIHQILPFDIEVRELDYGVSEDGTPNDFNLDVNNKRKLTTVYKNCWLTSGSKSIAQGTDNVVEQTEVFVTRPIYSTS